MKDGSASSESFFFYVSIGQQLVNYSIEFNELIENDDKIRSYAEMHLKSSIP
jgi:hypothetical protein